MELFFPDFSSLLKLIQSFWQHRIYFTKKKPIEAVCRETPIHKDKTYPVISFLNPVRNKLCPEFSSFKRNYPFALNDEDIEQIEKQLNL